VSRKAAVITGKAPFRSPSRPTVSIILSDRCIKNKVIFDIWGVVLTGGGDGT
jgi:hypothetical protein